MKNNFRGWTSVYAFTFSQAVKEVGFKIVTTLIALLLIVGFVVINIVVAKPDKDIKPSPIGNVYVLDNSGLQPTDFKALFSQLEDKEFNGVEFIPLSGVSSETAVKTAGEKSTETIAVIITKQDSGYELKAIIPAKSNITQKQAENLLQPMVSSFESNKLMQAGLSMEQLAGLLKPVVVSLAKTGENTNEIAKVIKVVAPMLFSFMMYFMILIYGQSISKVVSTEKTSKLMEALLTSIHPYAMITGKVLAMTSMALGQFVLWIAASVIGLYGGNAVAHQIYPQYENAAITIINFLKDNIGQTALSTPSIILAILFFCLGFLFYCIIAAVTGSMVSKPEDVAYTQMLFQMPVLAGWLVSYFGPLLEIGGLTIAARYIPLTSPFSVPAELITGTIGVGQGLISMAILLAFSLLTIILSAKLYKGFVLYNGQKLSLKVVGNILKSKE